MSNSVKCVLFAALVFVLAACSGSGNRDAEVILRTIPADASSVVVVNLNQSVKSFGGKTDGAEISLPDKVKSAIEQSSQFDSEQKKFISDLCAGNTGVAISSMAYFSSARSYVTGILNDPDKFVDYVSRALACPSDSAGVARVETADGARVIAGKVAVIGNQFWASTDGSPDVDQLKYYADLNEKQSYAANDYAPLLLEEGKVFAYVADVKRSLDKMPQAAYLRMACSLVFDDFAYIAGSAKFNDFVFSSSAQMLDSDMKPAKLLLPSEKIDPSVLKSLDASGGVFVAAGLPKKLVKKISDALAGVIGSNASALTAPLLQIDGTAAACFDMKGHAFVADIQTSGEDFAALSNLLNSIPGANVSRNGDMVCIKSGDLSAAAGISAAEAASRLKGAWIGLVAVDEAAKDVTAVLRVVPADKSVTLDVEVEIKGGWDTVRTAILK